MGATKTRLRLFGLGILLLGSLVGADAVWAQREVSFIARRDFRVGELPVSVAVGDFNGDGHLDLAAANLRSNTVSILLGRGDGSFEAAPAVGVGVEPVSVAVGDFNGDGHLDLAVANQGISNPGTVSILLGRGDGSFEAAPAVGVGQLPRSIAVGDFNSDGRQDLATANGFSNSASILLGRGDGSFQAAPDVGVGRLPNSVAVGDFNSDGRQDLATANGLANTVSILINNTSDIVVNDLVTFEPVRSTFRFTPDPTGCPLGFVGIFRFEARLTNISEHSLSDLAVAVTLLNRGNLLQNADGGPGGVGARLTVPQQDGFTDGALSPDEFVDVPFRICLTQRQPFRLEVAVLGVADASADAQARAFP